MSGRQWTACTSDAMQWHSWASASVDGHRKPKGGLWSIDFYFEWTATSHSIGPSQLRDRLHLAFRLPILSHNLHFPIWYPEKLIHVMKPITSKRWLTHTVPRHPKPWRAKRPILLHTLLRLGHQQILVPLRLGRV